MGWGTRHASRNGLSRSDTILGDRYAGRVQPRYVWHDLAQVWQTPQVGEQAVAQMVSMPAEALARGYEGLGMTAAIARKVAAAANGDMGRGNPGAIQIGRATDQSRSRGRLAAGSRQTWPRVNCDRRPLLRRGDARAPMCRTRRREHCCFGRGGHWRMCQQPKQGADAINSFLAKLN